MVGLIMADVFRNPGALALPSLVMVLEVLLVADNDSRDDEKGDEAQADLQELQPEP